jgi:hypothetical protein
VTIEDPHELLARLKLGREEFCQRLLTMLILDGVYPRWNTESTPSPDGLRFLGLLEALSFGFAGTWDAPVFVDELDLPRRHEAEQGGAPDQSLRDDKRLWLIELKTEAGSHRSHQIPFYFELGRHHYPAHRLDITYLTGPLDKPGPTVPAGCRYAHTTWDQVLPLVDEVWRNRPGIHGTVVAAMREVLGSLAEPWSQWRATKLGMAASVVPVPAVDPVADALVLARATAADHQQRACEFSPASLEELQEFRLDVRNAIRAAREPDLLHVVPWLWQPSSTGAPLTPGGREVGYELRLSWYLSPAT